MEQLSSAIRKLDQLDSLMYAIEGAAEEVRCSGEESRRLTNLFYILWDQKKMVRDDMIIIQTNT